MSEEVAAFRDLSAWRKRMYAQARPASLPRPREPEPPPESREDRLKRIEPLRSSPPRMLFILHCVAAWYDVSVDDIVSPRRDAWIMRPRHVAMWLVKTLASKRYPAIGGVFHRDHTSILNGVRKIERLLKSDVEIAADLAGLIAFIAGSHD